MAQPPAPSFVLPPEPARQQRGTSVESDPCGDAVEDAQWAPIRELTEHCSQPKQYLDLRADLLARLDVALLESTPTFCADGWRRGANQVVAILYERVAIEADRSIPLLLWADEMAVLCARGHFVLSQRASRAPRSGPSFAPFSFGA